MKDYGAKAFRSHPSPRGKAAEYIRFCLRQLFKDRRHTVMEEVVEGLTFEELIGTLVDAEDEIKAFVAERKFRDDWEEKHGKNI